MRLHLSVDLSSLASIVPPSDFHELRTLCLRCQEKKEKQRDANALYAIQQAVGDANFSRIMGASSAKEAWDLLKEEFQGTEKVRAVKRQTLRRDLENLKMKDSEIIKNYYSRLRELINQLRAYGEEISETRIVEKILISLTEKYDTAIETSSNISTLSATELIGSLEAFEKRLSSRNDETIESAFQSKLNLRSQNFQKGKRLNDHHRGGERPQQWENKKVYKEKRNFPPCGVCKNTNHREVDCWFRGKPKCRNCNKFGHVEKNCRNKKSHQANFSEENDEDQYLFYSSEAAPEEKNTK